MDLRHIPLVAASLLLFSCGSSRPTTRAEAVPDHRALLSQQAVDAVLWQHSSAEAHYLQWQAFQLAMWRLDMNIMETFEEDRSLAPDARDERPFAVVVDVDETMLDNSPYEMHLLRSGDVYTPESWKEWTDKAEAKAIPGAVEFARYARSMECEVFYITNRDTSERASTLRNLMEQGFPFVDEEHLLLMAGTSDKTARRARVDSTHRVMLFVGDQLTDFDQALRERGRNNGKDLLEGMTPMLARRFVLLPNAMYGYWRDAITGRGGWAEKLLQVKSYIANTAYRTMRVVLQRVLEASVHIGGAEHARIGAGLLVLLGVEVGDTPEELEWICGKVVRMRLFPDVEGVMNLDITQAHGEVLLVSQFTLQASTAKGNRPSYIRAARPEEAVPLYLRAKQRLGELLGRPVRTGEFGADMQVGLVNDGPVTIVLDSRLKE